jgi:serine/threonine-protein kinase RIO1
MSVPVISGNVVLKQKLGEGAAATVYKAVVDKEQTVALKVYRTCCESVYVSEANLLSAVDHE